MYTNKGTYSYSRTQHGMKPGSVLGGTLCGSNSSTLHWGVVFAPCANVVFSGAWWVR